MGNTFTLYLRWIPNYSLCAISDGRFIFLRPPPHAMRRGTSDGVGRTDGARRWTWESKRERGRGRRDAPSNRVIFSFSDGVFRSYRIKYSKLQLEQVMLCWANNHVKDYPLLFSDVAHKDRDHFISFWAWDPLWNDIWGGLNKLRGLLTIHRFKQVSFIFHPNSWSKNWSAVMSDDLSPSYA